MNSESVMRWVKDEEDLRKQQRKQVSELQQESAVPRDGSEVVHGVQRALKEGIGGERMVVSSMCKAGSHRAGARYQLPISRWMVFGLQEMPPNKHEASHQHLPERARG